MLSAIARTLEDLFEIQERTYFNVLLMSNNIMHLSVHYDI